ncbi:cytochrome c oxidase subunit 3 [Hymenobacter sp. BT507]|uniref:Cytochrome c oxidase subunit 3 n=1 Tax=Hymenobacter citatus TaxID=2763506 RepID=A0ABR7MEY5_9BACT|nr:cytochrome c oxidase subunit 3 [Hymenobacter citatus]MBC6609654.1 cytochrome c oxidase subunit 3 [Hymenobacter citatus]
MNSDFGKERQGRIGANRPTPSTRPARVPLSLLLLYLGLVGSLVLFVVLISAYAHTRYTSGVPAGLHPFPRYFSISTVVLLASSYTLSQARRLYRDDDVTNLARCLGATLLLGLAFAGLQALGWHELQVQGVFFRDKPSGTYVYLISAIHVMHLLGGVLFLTLLFLRAQHASRDSIRTLLFIRDPYRRLQLKLMSTYWHFVDALWVLLFCAFLFLY